MISIDKVGERLTARLNELNNKVAEIDNTLREPDSADSEERAVENEGDEVLEDMGNAALVEISQIQAALERISLDTYGVCTVCHADIDDKRLDSIPYAANCVRCATEMENSHS